MTMHKACFKSSRYRFCIGNREMQEAEYDNLASLGLLAPEWSVVIAAPDWLSSPACTRHLPLHTAHSGGHSCLIIVLTLLYLLISDPKLFHPPK